MIEVPSYENIILILNPPNIKIESEKTETEVKIKAYFDLPNIILKRKE